MSLCVFEEVIHDTRTCNASFLVTSTDSRHVQVNSSLCATAAFYSFSLKLERGQGARAFTNLSIVGLQYQHNQYFIAFKRGRDHNKTRKIRYLR